MPGSPTTPGHPGARAHAPVCIAFRLRNGVGTRDMNLYEAQWLAYVVPCRRFAAALAGDRARLGVDVDRYSFIVSDLHRLLIAGLPAHCEKLWTLPGAKTADVCRKYRISSATFYKWKGKYGGLDVSDAKRLKALEDENNKLKKLLADAMLDNAMLKEIATKKW